ncbi:MAG: hypothetical protein QOK00_895, partial [Thermoleophilaceae bacterium]|nr:hypothetical protein [Thermoleophilaceae bacterium]
MRRTAVAACVSLGVLLMAPAAALAA